MRVMQQSIWSKEQNVLCSLVSGQRNGSLGPEEIRRFVDRKEDKMFTQLRKAARALRPATASEREIAYLNDATDRIDLEYRQRAVDRGMFRNAGF